MFAGGRLAFLRVVAFTQGNLAPSQKLLTFVLEGKATQN